MSHNHTEEPWAPMRRARSSDDRPPVRAIAVTMFVFGALVVVLNERSLALRLYVSDTHGQRGRWSRGAA